MARRIWVLAAALTIGVGLAAAPIRTLADDAPGVTEDSVTVGAWVILSGPNAVYGVPLRAGVEAYFNNVNENGGVNGRKINWLVEDDGYNPQQTVAIARKFVARDNILATVVAHGTPTTAATLPYMLDQQKVPMLLPYAGAKEWYSPPKPGLLGLHVLYEDQANALGRWMGNDGHKNVLVIHSAHAAFENVANNVEPGLLAVAPDARVEMMAVKLGTTDYGPIVLDVTRKAPDAIVSIQPLGDIVQLAKGLKQQGKDIPIYSYAPTVAQSTIDLGGEYVEGLKSLSLTVSPFADTPTASEYRELLAKYAPDQKPDFVSFLGFGAAKIFAEALSKAKEPLTRDSLVQAFYELNGYDSGVFPPVSFSPEEPIGGHLLQPMVIKDGQWTPAGEVIDVRAF